MPLRAAALPVGLSVRQRANPRQGQEGLQAAVGAQQDIGVQAIPDHQAALSLHAELGGHTVEHEVVGLAHRLGPTLGCCLHSLQQAARP